MQMQAYLPWLAERVPRRRCSGRYTRGKKARSRSRERRARLSSPGGAARDPRTAAIGGSVPHRRRSIPHQRRRPGVRPPLSVPVRPSSSHWRRLRPCYRSGGLRLAPADSPTRAEQGPRTRPRSPWPVGGRPGVRGPSSVAAHMHATASDRRTSRRSRSCHRRSSSRTPVCLR